MSESQGSVAQTAAPAQAAPQSAPAQTAAPQDTQPAQQTAAPQQQPSEAQQSQQAMYGQTIEQQTQDVAQSLYGEQQQTQQQNPQDVQQKVQPPSVPESYDFAVPEGVTLDDAVIKSTTELFRKNGLSAESGKAMWAAHVDGIKSVVAEFKNAYENEQKQRYTALQNDPELGGANREAAMRNVQVTLQRYGTPELRTFLQKDIAGLHPEVVRLLARVGKDLSTDTNVVSGNSSGNTRSRSEQLRNLYDNSPELKF